MSRQELSLYELNDRLNPKQLADGDVTLGARNSFTFIQNPSTNRNIVLDNDFFHEEEVTIINQSYKWNVHIYNGPFKLENLLDSNATFSVDTEDINPLGIAWNDDGSKLYMVGASNDNIYQYTASTPFDISTLNYDGVSLDVSTEDTTPNEIAWNDDGTKMYLLGQTNVNIYQYTATTPFDLSTVSYDSVSFDISPQTTFPEGFAWNNDGSKLYTVGSDTDSIYQYTASTPFDISTLNYDGVSLDVSEQDDDPNGMLWSKNGTKLYIVGNINDAAYQYSASTAFDLSTVSYDGVSFSVGTRPNSIIWNNDGTKLYVMESDSGSINQYPIANLRTLHPRQSATFTAIQDNPEGPGDWSFLKPEGFLLKSAVFQVSLDVSSEITSPTALTWSNDGTKLHVSDNSGTVSVIYQYTASIPRELSTVYYDNVSLDVTSEENNISGFAWNNDGTKLYVIGTGSDSIYQYTASTPFDLSTVSYDSVSFDISTEDTTPTGIQWKHDGTKLYMIGHSSDSIHQYSASTPFDLSTVSYDSVSFDISTEDTLPQAMIWNNDGSNLYMVGNNAGIYQYSASTPFDVGTLSYDGFGLDVSPQEGAPGPSGIVWNNDGTKLYMSGFTNDNIYQYSTGHLIQFQ